MKRIHAIIITALAVAGFCNIDGANAAPVIKMNCDHGVTATYRQTYQVNEQSGKIVKANAIDANGVSYSVGIATQRVKQPGTSEGDLWLQTAMKPDNHNETATFAFTDAMYDQHQATLILMNIKTKAQRGYDCTWRNDQE